MPADRFLIAPFTTGLQTDVKPWLIPDDAFEVLRNAYVYEGRVRKRFGSRLLNESVDADVAQLNSRLRIKIGTAIADPDTINIPGSTLTVGRLFSLSDGTILTVDQIGAGVATLSTNDPAITATIDTTVSPNTITVTGGGGLDLFYYPSTPVMGFSLYETSPINQEPTFAFDTQFAYEFTSGAWERLGSAVWTGGPTDFFWADTWRGITANEDYLFVTNNTTADGIRYWNGSAWTTLNPLYNTTQTIETCRIIVPFKDRLLFLNVVEKVSGAPNRFRNRCRFSQNGDPRSADAWREDTPGKGGYTDAPTQEGIISAAFLKDRLIVFFERSTWELVYTGNEVLPFRWQQINTELGVESPFSVVQFDKAVLGIGNVGIHACNGANVERIDDKIHHDIFKFENNSNGVLKVQGIRDFYTEMVYWVWPDPSRSFLEDPLFPTRVLVYNYKNGSWALNDDSITAFGYFQNPNNIRWNNINSTWEESEGAWDDGTLESRFLNVIAGNQQGFTFIIASDNNRNSPALQITNAVAVGNSITLTVINHNLTLDDYIIIENMSGMTGVNNIVYKISSITDADTFAITQPNVAGTYTGGGTIARVSRIDIYTKQYNFYQQQGRNASIERIDFLVDKTSTGEVTVDTLPSSSQVSLLNGGAATGALVDTGVLETSPYAIYPLEQAQARLWHPIYSQSEGETVQLRIYLSDSQMTNTNISWSGFQINAMLFHARPTSDRLQ